MHRRRNQRGASTLWMVAVVGALLVVVIPSIIDTFSNSRLYARNIWDQTLANTLAVSHVDAFLAYYNRYTGDASDVTNYVDQYCNQSEIKYNLNNGKEVSLRLDCVTTNDSVTGESISTITGYAKVGKEEAKKQFTVNLSLKDATNTLSEAQIDAEAIDQIPIKDDIPVPSVQKSFNIHQYETDYRLWYHVYDWAISNGYAFKADGLGIEGSDGGKARDVNATPRVLVPYSSFRQPVTTVSFANVIVWLNAFSEMSKRAPVYRDTNDDIIKDVQKVSNFDNVHVRGDADGYKLPTEEQWEIAARWVGRQSTPSCPDMKQISSADSTTKNTYCWTIKDGIAGETSGVQNSKRVWYNVNANGKAQPTGKLEPTAIALHDMSGNVAEMVVKMNGNNIDKVFTRGGSWKTDPVPVGAQGVQVNNAGSSSDDVGFRMVRNK